MTQEVVTREDVVDLEAFGAGEALAHVALEQALAMNEGGSLAIREQAVDRAMARLTARVRLHGSLGKDLIGSYHTPCRGALGG
jgi:hypothetical protein